METTAKEVTDDSEYSSDDDMKTIYSINTDWWGIYQRKLEKDDIDVREGNRKRQEIVDRYHNFVCFFLNLIYLFMIWVLFRLVLLL